MRLNRPGFSEASRINEGSAGAEAAGKNTVTGEVTQEPDRVGIGLSLQPAAHPPCGEAGHEHSICRGCPEAAKVLQEIAPPAVEPVLGLSAINLAPVADAAGLPHEVNNPARRDIPA